MAKKYKMRHITEASTLATKTLDIAHETGQAIMNIYNKIQSLPEGPERALVTQKADLTPLTQADLAAHRTLTAALARLTPAIPRVSEEDESASRHRHAKGEFWLVDPLDGTKEFLPRNRV